MHFCSVTVCLKKDNSESITISRVVSFATATPGDSAFTKPKGEQWKEATK